MPSLRSIKKILSGDMQIEFRKIHRQLHTRRSRTYSDDKVAIVLIDKFRTFIHQHDLSSIRVDSQQYVKTTMSEFVMSTQNSSCILIIGIIRLD